MLPKLAKEACDEISDNFQTQLKLMPTFLSPMAFVDNHWTDKFKQIEYTSLAAYLVDGNFELSCFDLCDKKYDGASKHAANIKDDLMKKLTAYVSK